MTPAPTISPDALTTLRVGRRCCFDAHNRCFRLTRVRGHVYHLCDLAITQRSRFGTLAQITEDITHVLAYGVLPGGTKGRW